MPKAVVVETGAGGLTAAVSLTTRVGYALTLFVHYVNGAFFPRGGSRAGGWIAMLSVTVAACACDRDAGRGDAQPSARSPLVAPQTSETSDASGPAEPSGQTTPVDAFTPLADPAEKLLRRLRSSQFCREEIDTTEESTAHSEWAPELEWAGAPTVGFVRGGVYCPPTDPLPCTAELEVVELDKHKAFVVSAHGLCNEDWEWKCSEWECVLDVTGGMQGFVRFVPRGDGAVLAGSFQTPWTSGDDGTVDIPAHKAKWEQKLEHVFGTP